MAEPGDQSLAGPGWSSANASAKGPCGGFVGTLSRFVHRPRICFSFASAMTSFGRFTACTTTCRNCASDVCHIW